MGVLVLCSAADKTHGCSIKSVLATSTEHSAVWAAVEKVESIPGRPRTPNPPWWGWDEQAGSRGVVGSQPKQSPGGLGMLGKVLDAVVGAPTLTHRGAQRDGGVRGSPDKSLPGSCQAHRRGHLPSKGPSTQVQGGTGRHHGSGNPNQGLQRNGHLVPVPPGAIPAEPPAPLPGTHRRGPLGHPSDWGV